MYNSISTHRTAKVETWLNGCGKKRKNSISLENIGDDYSVSETSTKSYKISKSDIKAIHSRRQKDGIEEYLVEWTHKHGEDKRMSWELSRDCMNYKVSIEDFNFYCKKAAVVLERCETSEDTSSFNSDSCIRRNENSSSIHSEIQTSFQNSDESVSTAPSSENAFISSDMVLESDSSTFLGSISSTDDYSSDEAENVSSLESEFEVRAIQGRRQKNGVVEYLVDWEPCKGKEYPMTWEPARNCHNSKELIHVYNKNWVGKKE